MVGLASWPLISLAALESTDDWIESIVEAISDVGRATPERRLSSSENL